MTLRQHELHLWTFSQKRNSADLTRECSVLCRDELDRAKGYRRKEVVNRFVRSRALLRYLLEGYTGVPAKEIGLSFGSHGKPELSPCTARSDIHFSLSHAADTTVYAFALDHNIGVDIEPEDEGLWLGEAGSGYLTSAEQAHCQSKRAADRGLWALRYWTRKEACLKAVGTGFLIAPETVDVASAPSVIVQMPRSPGQPPETRQLHVTDLQLKGGYVGALAVDRAVGPLAIRYFHFNDQISPRASSEPLPFFGYLRNQ